jgi:hypothetical protein
MKAADVGISVDTAVDVAKESADIILLEKSLLVLEDGIIEGRKVSATSSSTSRWGPAPTSGTCSAWSGPASSSFRPFLPMAPIQLLVNNLLYDFSQVGIPLDNVRIRAKSAFGSRRLQRSLGDRHSNAARFSAPRRSMVTQRTGRRRRTPGAALGAAMGPIPPYGRAPISGRGFAVRGQFRTSGFPNRTPDSGHSREAQPNDRASLA